MARIKNKRIVNIIIFGLAVMALLLRPYLAYQLTESRQLTKDPVALNNLLQRLVKKKDDHHTVDGRDLCATRCTENKIPPQLRRAAQRTLPLTRQIVIWNHAAVITKAGPVPAYYKLFSTYRI